MNASPLELVRAAAPGLSREEIRSRIAALGKWFHNLDLGGVQTAPNHFLGDYPREKFKTFAHAIPQDLRGKTVLDIGCNGGFYSMEMKRRGADRVLAIDFDEEYLAQARFAAEVASLDIEFQQLSVYDVGKLGERFDVVLFMGVLYHLRHPLLALDLIREHVASDLLVFQSMQRGSDQIREWKEDYNFNERWMFEEPAFPRMYFIEKKYSEDPTNWWVPNRACSAAMLRSAGFEVLENPEEEVFICKARQLDCDTGAVYPAKQEGR
jgi:tRNA (mo5U34)-methyltransferase